MLFREGIGSIHLSLQTTENIKNNNSNNNDNNREDVPYGGPFEWAQKKGLFPSFVKLNFHGKPEMAVTFLLFIHSKYTGGLLPSNLYL